jgi:hypothetical protein
VASIAVTPANPTIAVGTTHQFSATGTLSDSTIQDLTSLVTWSSSNTLIATTNSGGIASSLSIGSVTVTAAFAGVSGTTTMTVQGPVSIAVTPANPSVVVGSTQQFTAVGTFADGSVQDLTTLALWSSSDSGVATISNTAGSRGLATVTAAGSSTITATLGVSGTATMAAKSLVSISVTPISPTIGAGTTLQLAATGTFSDSSTQDLTTSVTWGTGNTGIATISNTWMSGFDRTYKNYIDYVFIGKNCQIMVNEMARAANIEEFVPRGAPNKTFNEGGSQGADSVGKF